MEGGEVIWRMVLLVPLEGLQEKLEAAFLDLGLILLELSHPLGALAYFREHFPN